MPRTSLSRKLGGTSGFIRKRYTVLQKCQVVKYAVALLAKGDSMRSISLDIQVPRIMLTRWCKQANLLQAQVKIGSQSLSMGTGPAGQLVSVEDQLHAWIFEKREQGMALSITHIVWKAQPHVEYERASSLRERDHIWRGPRNCVPYQRG